MIIRCIPGQGLCFQFHTFNSWCFHFFQLSSSCINCIFISVQVMYMLQYILHSGVSISICILADCDKCFHYICIASSHLQVCSIWKNSRSCNICVLTAQNDTVLVIHSIIVVFADDHIARYTDFTFTVNCSALIHRLVVRDGTAAKTNTSALVVNCRARRAGTVAC